tara:strand:+ start:371 stop:544 length:174 start_codon:yes stop_codon:yes gene_type:complete
MEYNVMFDLCFTAIAKDEFGDSLSGKEIREAIYKRLSNLSDSEIKEVVGFSDSYVED